MYATSALRNSCHSAINYVMYEVAHIICFIGMSVARTHCLTTVVDSDVIVAKRIQVIAKRR